jgi:murein DD-endopeptidase MepM/ murein hydrolase activator NlpD
VSGGVSPAALEAAGLSLGRPMRRAALSFSLERLMIPVAGITAADLADTFSARRSGGRTHRAIDIMAPRGTPVLAISDGRIVRKHHNRLGGKVLYLRSPDGRYAFYYAHLMDYAPGIAEGVTVLQGDTLGYVGNTGNARHTAPHLHFQIIEAGGRSDRAIHSGRAVNPYPLLSRSLLHRDRRIVG